MNIKNIIKYHSGSVHIVNTNSGSGNQINNFSNNTVHVNGKTITLPKNYNSMTINNGVVIIDGVRYDGEEVSKVRKEKIIEFDNTILDIQSEVANINVEIVKDKQSNITYDSNEYEVNVVDEHIIIKNIVDEITSGVTIIFNKTQLDRLLNLDIGRSGNIDLKGIDDKLNTFLNLTTRNGNISINNIYSTENVLLKCKNGNISQYINCYSADIETVNGNIRGTIRVKEDSSIKVKNGNIKITTLSKVVANNKNGNIKIKNHEIDNSKIDVYTRNGNIQID